MDDFAAALKCAVARMVGGTDEITGLARLSGGANMESWSFDGAGTGYVLRRAPSAALMAERPYDHATEAALIRVARASGVRAPEVVGELVPGDELGSGYLMHRVEGEVRPDRILAAPPPGFLAELAGELALIHAIPLDRVPPGLPQPTPAELLAALDAQFEGAGGDRPVMALALAWLRARLPAPVAPVLLHGDFRMGNLLVGEHGLAAVLDWELAHLGDRHQDLAYGCINSWRFGRIKRPAFGLGAFAELWAAYEQASGHAVAPDRFRWWLVYSTLWWGLCCLGMAAMWRDGRDPALERAVIGRRASETEVDLLLLIEADARASEREPVALPDPEPVTPRGEPSAQELAAAVGRWLAAEIKPALAGRPRFEANVALTALGMIAREGPSGRDRTLAQDLLAGRADLATPGLLARLRRDALAKLAADQPKYSALAHARALWCR